MMTDAAAFAVKCCPDAVQVRLDARGLQAANVSVHPQTSAIVKELAPKRGAGGGAGGVPGSQPHVQQGPHLHRRLGAASADGQEHQGLGRRRLVHVHWLCAAVAAGGGGVQGRLLLVGGRAVVASACQCVMRMCISVASVRPCGAGEGDCKCVVSVWCSQCLYAERGGAWFPWEASPPSLTPTRTHTRSLTHTLTHSLTHSLTLSHTHARAYTHTRIRIYGYAHRESRGTHTHAAFERAQQTRCPGD